MWIDLKYVFTPGESNMAFKLNNYDVIYYWDQAEANWYEIDFQNEIPIALVLVRSEHSLKA